MTTALSQLIQTSVPPATQLRYLLAQTKHWKLGQFAKATGSVAWMTGLTIVKALLTFTAASLALQVLVYLGKER